MSNVLMICGSLRKGSFNRALMNALPALAPADMKLTEAPSFRGHTIGLQVQVLNASTIGEINAAFATFARERPDALFVAPVPLFTNRRMQLANLAARERIPAVYAQR